MLVRLFACGFAYFVAGLIFYGFNLSRKAFVTNSIFVNMLFTGVIDFLAEVLVAATCR